ncbi:lipoxygenase [Penicillium cf. griseofulvum]|uniref:Lipoxygenase n=1 Tax=Penicillium cf. griseofulvum TaxID=2972120 RepID=A0A9W9MYV8_9EURO|nr:lipoxygenase [Penicillium cf. griseofulvum]KAJ5421470.1 lipoxygenase [Penicillium cf. griseofulvum]KAJ5424702.1 lipoxygenase [Penicillium cf. griseofulvum]
MVRNLTATSSKWPKNPEEAVLDDMDTAGGLGEKPRGLACAAFEQKEPVRIKEGTYRGIQLALTKVYDLIEQQYMSFMDVAQVEPLIPTALTRLDKRDFFVFTKGEDGYPPHLDLGLNKEWANNNEEGKNQRSDLGPFALFNTWRLIQLSFIMGTIAEVEDYNRERRAGWWGQDIFDRPNVGDLKDWYSDARFSQQHFATTITRASNDWIYHFTQAAKTSDDADAKDVISKLSTRCPESFYVQDYSYFRTITDIDSADEIKYETKMGPKPVLLVMVARRQNMCAMYVPYLLSFKPNEKTETLMGCIYTTWYIYYNKSSPSDVEKKIRDALHRFYQALQASDDEFER